MQAYLTDFGLSYSLWRSVILGAPWVSATDSALAKDGPDVKTFSIRHNA